MGIAQYLFNFVADMHILHCGRQTGTTQIEIQESEENPIDA